MNKSHQEGWSKHRTQGVSNALVNAVLIWQRELWCLIGIPGIEGIAALGQQFGKGSRQGDRCLKIEAVMTGGIRSKIFGSSEKESPRRGESPAMFWIDRKSVV